VLPAADAPGDVDGCIVCLGERSRGDDGVGPLVADEIRRSHPDVDVRECRDPFDLIDAVGDAARVVVVDAARVGDDPTARRVAVGSVHAVADLEQAHGFLGLTSTHGFGPVEVLALAGAVRAGGAADATVTLVAVVGERFDIGADVSDAVTAAVPFAAEQAVRLLSGST
jgi:hydrogenase maturation protease